MTSDMIEAVACVIYGEDDLDGLGEDVRTKMMDRAREVVAVVRAYQPLPPPAREGGSV